MLPSKDMPGSTISANEVPVSSRNDRDQRSFLDAVPVMSAPGG